MKILLNKIVLISIPRVVLGSQDSVVIRLMNRYPLQIPLLSDFQSRLHNTSICVDSKNGVKESIWRSL